MPGIFDVGGERITNLGTPTNPDHAATKEYVDDNGGGGSQPEGFVLTPALVLAAPFTVANTATGLVGTPDGATILVLDASGSEVIPIDVASLIAGAAISIANPRALVVSPDSATAYVLSDESTLAVVDLATGNVVQSVEISFGNHVYAIGITPDGSEIWAAVFAADNEIVVIPTGTLTPATPFAAAEGAAAIGAVTFTPDGATAYLSADSPDGILPVDVASKTPGALITDGSISSPTLLAITPDGATLYVLNSNSSIAQITTDTNTPGAAITTISDLGLAVQTIAVLPSGTRLVFTDGGDGLLLTLGVPGLSLTTIPLTSPQALAVTGERIYVLDGATPAIYTVLNAPFYPLP